MNGKNWKDHQSWRGSWQDKPQIKKGDSLSNQTRYERIVKEVFFAHAHKDALVLNALEEFGTNITSKKYLFKN